MSNDELDESASEPAEAKVEAPAFKLSPDPLVFGKEESETEGASHKFEVAPHPVATAPAEAPAFEQLGELPSSYYQDVLFLVARDPRWLFTYWDFNQALYAPAAFRGGVPQFFLKVLTADGSEESVVEIKADARNWYVPVNHANASYSVELGFFEASGSWHSIIRSGSATTPSDTIASEEGTAFATVPTHLTFERLIGLVKEGMAEGQSLIEALSRISGEGKLQFRPGQAPTWSEEQKRILAALLGDSLTDQLALGSEEIDQLLRKQLTQKLYSESASLSIAGLESLFAPGPHSLYSGIGASWSAQPFSTHQERGFFMHVNAEIIFYGGTHPDASVWIDGAQVRLQPDGSFRYHFTLPDGDFAIPIVARSPDRVEERSATLSFARGTARIGQVDHTGQPEDLRPLIGRK